MIEKQRTLLADLRMVQEDARKLCEQGVKISGVYEKVRAAGDQLETRVRALDRVCDVKPPKKPKTPKPAAIGLAAPSEPTTAPTPSEN